MNEMIYTWSESENDIRIFNGKSEIFSKKLSEKYGLEM